MILNAVCNWPWIGIPKTYGKGLIEMKRILCTILALCILLSAVCVHASAEVRPQGDYDADPVVFLLGYSTADLYYDDGVSAEKERVWNLTADGVVDRLVKNLPKVLLGVFLAVVLQRYDVLDDVAGVIAEPVLQKMERLTMLPDGSSKYDVSVYPGRGEVPLSFRKSSRNVYLSAEYKAFLQAYGRVYVFVADWRYGQLELARQLDAFIQQVKDDSGRDQVTLFGFSQGGQTISTYLYLYGDKGDVKKAVMETPAIGGTTFAAAALDESLFDIPVETMIRFSEAYMGSEKHYEWLGKLVTLAPLKKAILSIVYTHVLPIARYWGSLWDMVPVADYERLKAEYLTDPACAKLIEASDRYHHEIVPHIGETLRALQAQGMSLSIVCNTGNALLFNSKTNSDGILDSANVSGATAEPLGERLEVKGGSQRLAPSMSLDVSTCYLPDNTWFVDGQFHGQCDWDPYTYALLCKLTMEDSLTDVNADPAFPQFMFAQSPADRLNISFAESGSFVSASDLTVTNLSVEKEIKLTSVYIRGAGLQVKVPKKTVLAPGESVTLSVSGSAPETAQYTPVTIIFATTDQPLLLQTKTFQTSTVSH